MNKYPISNRCSKLDPSATLEISDLAKEIQESGKEVISLAVGEPDMDTPKEIKNKAKKALDNGKTKYTSSKGIPELRKQITKKFKEDNNIDTNPENIIVTPGAKFSLYLACQALLNSEDKAIIPDPAWVSYKQMIKSAEAKPIPIPTNDEFMMKPEQVKERIDSKVNIIFANSPNNPTGKVWKKSDLKALAEIAEEYNAILLSDEIYENLIYKGTHYSPASDYDNVLTVNGFSKSYSMTGWRLGYMEGPEKIMEEILKIQQHSVSCPTSFAQKGAVKALKDIDPEKLAKEFEGRREKVIKKLRGMENISIEAPDGAFYVFPEYDIDMKSKELALDLLKEKGVAVTHGRAFGEKGEGHIRLSYANSLDNINEALNKLEEFLKEKNKDG